MQVETIIDLSNKLTRCAKRVREEGVSPKELSILKAWIVRSEFAVNDNTVPDSALRKYIQRQINTIHNQCIACEERFYGME